MKIKKVLLLTLIFLCGLQLFAQAKLSRYPGAMFWKIEGTDAKGNPSEIYVLGTIHVGDDRLFPLPDFVEEAWKSADCHVCEISSAEWKQLQPKLQTLIMKSAGNTVKLKRSLKKDLTPEEISYIEELNPMYKMMLGFEPWVLNQVLSETLLMDSGLEAGKGYDSYFIARADQEGIELEGLDELQVQIDVITYGDWDYQLNQVRQGIKELKSGEALEKLEELYETYLTFDDKLLEEMYIDGEVAKELEEHPENSEYFEALFGDRNSNWAEEFNEYLLKGGKTFIFAGCGHFVGNGSVFNLMKERGYLQF